MAQHLLTVADLGVKSVEHCLQLAARCKRSPNIGSRALAGKTLALIFQKPSIRTRVSFQVAIAALGGSTVYLAPEDIQLDKREPVKDVARTLSRYVEGVIVRTFTHQQVEEFARFSTVPVINGLSDLHHPCQALADVLTVQERIPKLKGVTIAYIGDGNNVLHSLAQVCGFLGINLRVATPKRYKPNDTIWQQAASEAATRGAEFLLTEDPAEAVKGADALYTDVWTSMGQEREQDERLKAFKGFQINHQLLSLAKPRCLVMHCLPAHRGEEITEDVLEGPQSVVFDQAENRLHAQKALLLMLAGGSAYS